MQVLFMLPERSNTTTAYKGFLISVEVVTFLPLILNVTVYSPRVFVLVTVFVTKTSPSFSNEPAVTVLL